jgi:hypothetical protein
MSGGVWFEQQYLRRMFDAPLAEKQDERASNQHLKAGSRAHLGIGNGSSDTLTRENVANTQHLSDCLHDLVTHP